MKNNNGRTWIGIATISVIVLSSVVGYIYAEATASRNRDVDITAQFNAGDTQIRQEIKQNQQQQMVMLHKIDKAVTVVRRDVAHLKGVD